jgi:hypothetical protein
VFAPFLWITAEDEPIRAGEGGVYLNPIQKMLESHLPGDGRGIGVQFLDGTASQQRFKQINISHDPPSYNTSALLQSCYRGKNRRIYY